VAFLIEVVVHRAVDSSEFLKGLHSAEPPHRPISSSEGEMAVDNSLKQADWKGADKPDILTPIPLTLVGSVIGHIIFQAPFTATSMIGFIALAGIIVRNSILLVDFIRHSQGDGRSLREVLLEAGTIRFKPIVLTAAAAMICAAVMLTDPIF